MNHMKLKFRDKRMIPSSNYDWDELSLSLIDGEPIEVECVNYAQARKAYTSLRVSVATHFDGWKVTQDDNIIRVLPSKTA